MITFKIKLPREVACLKGFRHHSSWNHPILDALTVLYVFHGHRHANQKDGTGNLPQSCLIRLDDLRVFGQPLATTNGTADDRGASVDVRHLPIASATSAVDPARNVKATSILLPMLVTS